MDQESKSIIQRSKERRSFNAKEYVDTKSFIINKFFQYNNLNSVVLGMSGGIDSALTYALLTEASKVEGSPIKKIRGLLMPIYGKGVTGQDSATERAVEYLESIKGEYQILNLTDAYDGMVNQRQEDLGDKNIWTDGQMASVLRTPMLYYQAAILQAQGYKSLVCGTTNRDEGSYIGFFGKGSDAMVDLQIISDIHKSEVYEISKCLNVSEEIIKSVPKGDVWDNRVDEEMIGAPYHFLEDYLLLREGLEFENNILGVDDYIECLINSNMINDQEKEWINNIEKIHNQNKHKYDVGNPAHFLDILNRNIPGGWQ